jgi:hypothetical protein
VVRLGLDRHRLAAAQPAGPPAPEDRRAGVSPLLRARGPAGAQAGLIRAAGLRWPVEESFGLAKGCFGLDQCQARLCTAVLRYLALVMAALAVCAVTAAQMRERTDAQTPPPAGPDDQPPPDPGCSGHGFSLEPGCRRMTDASLTGCLRPQW